MSHDWRKLLWAVVESGKTIFRHRTLGKSADDNSYRVVTSHKGCFQALHNSRLSVRHRGGSLPSHAVAVHQDKWASVGLCAGDVAAVLVREKLAPCLGFKIDDEVAAVLGYDGRHDVHVALATETTGRRCCHFCAHGELLRSLLVVAFLALCL
jgi:hypothetical protein